MQKAKRKNESQPLRRYWRIFLPLLVLLTVFLRFPLRIFLRDMVYTIIMYGAVSVLCVIVALWVYRRYGRLARRLVAVIALCAIFSGWQVFDLTVLRTNTRSPASGIPINPSHSRLIGWAWYYPRFPDYESIYCHSIQEHYFGIRLIAIAYSIEYKPWFACGG